VYSGTVIVVVVVLGTTSPALAECLAQSTETSAIVEAINRADGCKASFYVMRACRNNGARDVELAAMVVNRCESTFLTASSADQLTLYEKERKSCAIKYGKMEGIIYASYRAICEAVAALRLAQ
jgi:hypothetical protein